MQPVTTMINYHFDSDSDADDERADERARHIEKAVLYLHARDYGGRYAYADAATGNAYLVDDECVAALGRQLATVLNQNGRERVFAEWSAQTEAIEVAAIHVYRSLDPRIGLADQRTTALFKDNLPLVVAIDFFPDTLRALLAPG